MQNIETKIPRSAKRGHIIETAFSLFKANGFYATGVDLIMREANVSKRTLYKHFPSKNVLIVTVLQYYRSTFQDHIESLLDQAELNSREKIKAIFRDAMGWFNDVNFHGCLAVNAMGEFSGKDQAIEEACLCFKRWEIDVFLGLTNALECRQPEELAHKLFVILEGMSAIAQVNKGAYPLDMVALADEMVAAHLKS